jgi:hypothetical protein
MNTTKKLNIAFAIVNIMLLMLVWSLVGQLRQSRANERELSRHLYEVGKYGRVNDGTQRPGDAEATNATRATPPGSLE